MTCDITACAEVLWTGKSITRDTIKCNQYLFCQAYKHCSHRVAIDTPEVHVKSFFDLMSVAGVTGVCISMWKELFCVLILYIYILGYTCMVYIYICIYKCIVRTFLTGNYTKQSICVCMCWFYTYTYVYIYIHIILLYVSISYL